MSASNATQQSLLPGVETLIAALMGDALPAEVASITEQLEAAAAQECDVPGDAAGEVRNAIALVRESRPCAAVSALLSARAMLGAPPR